MISKEYGSKILNTLVGLSSNTLASPSNVYLGLCVSEPTHTNGVLTDVGEPTTVSSYERKRVGGSGTGTAYFGSSSNNGIIKNNVEIQLKTAREDYPAKINYWFLSTSQTGGSAFLWGRIKDVLSDTKTVTGFVAEAEYNTYTASTTCDLLDFESGKKYVVAWDGKEYEVTATLYENEGTSYIGFGNPYTFGGAKDDVPFSILYNVTTTGTNTVGNLKIYSLTGEGNHSVALYGIGITIKKATVPTFYENELQVSIDN